MSASAAQQVEPAVVQPAPSSLRQLPRIAALAVLLGILTTLASAWPLPLLLLAYGVIAHTTWSKDMFWTTTTHGGHYTHSHLALSDWVIFKRIIFTGGAEAQPYYQQNPPPPWACVLSLDGSEGFEEVHTAATGWPRRAMASEAWERWQPAAGQAGEELRHNLVLASLPSGRIILPLRPIWGGLMVDSAVWGLAWVPVLVVPGMVRRRLRRKRGKCVACGYDRAALGPTARCPECGAASAAA